MLIEWQCSKFPAPFEARVKADSVTPAFRKCGFVVRSMSKPRRLHTAMRSKAWFCPSRAKLCRHPAPTTGHSPHNFANKSDHRSHLTEKEVEDLIKVRR